MENKATIITQHEQQCVTDIKSIVSSARTYAYKSANLAQVVSNWLIGRKIAEQEKEGQDRAEYGKYIMQMVADELTAEFGTGYSLTNIKNFARFYLSFKNLAIGQTLSDQFTLPLGLIGQTVSDQLTADETQTGQTVSDQSEIPLYGNISWSHYEALLRVPDEKARRWYLDESAQENWSVRTLRRNISTQYYYRLMQTPADKRDAVEKEMHAKTAEFQDKAEFVKNPIIMEFLGVKRDAALSESELESKIIEHLQQFIMEMGKGFAFVARQQRVSTDMGDFYIDLVFYNYILKCFFLIDLKTGMVTHQDVGQMDMYVRMYDDLKRGKGDNPTIGLLLGSDTSRDMARYSVLHGNEQLFQAKYMTILPTEEELVKEIGMQKEIYLMQKENQKDE